MISEKKFVDLVNHKAFDKKFIDLHNHALDLSNRVDEYLHDGGVFSQKITSSKNIRTLTYEALLLKARMTQILTWLMLERAARTKDMPFSIVKDEKNKLNFKLYSTALSDKEIEFIDFYNLIVESLKLQRRIVNLAQQDRCLKHKDGIKEQYVRLTKEFQKEK